MLAQLLQLLGILTLGAAAMVFARARQTRGNAPRARALVVIGTGYMVFGTHAWRITTTAGVWSHLMFDIGALALVVFGARALVASRAPVEAFVRGMAGDDPLPGAVPQLALVFVGRLAALGPVGWAHVVGHADAHAATRAPACAIVSVIVADLRLEGGGRYLTRAIADVLCGPGARQLSTATRAHALTVARDAALAVLVRPTLPDEDFDALYAPFEYLMPAATLRDCGVVAASRGQRQ